MISPVETSLAVQVITRSAGMGPVELPLRDHGHGRPDPGSGEEAWVLWPGTVLCPGS
jgi:hypothetical protein